MTLAKEQRQVLDLLAEGKINAEEAARLLERLNGSAEAASTERSAFSGRGDAGGTMTAILATAEPRASDRAEGSTKPLKYLRILVHSEDGDDVNIRVPLQLVRAGLKLTTVLPQDAREKIRESGVDLSSLSELQGE
ncbi:MAG: hypothetical protein KC729_05260, partial [Candidatus Eisenbacteria bacterium]|nr:hypothetical protein [Candidatus Eisenbacteria bacterium]